MMKKYLIFISVFCLFCFNNMFCQVGESRTVEESALVGVADKMVGYPRLDFYKREDGNNLYLLTYINLEYANIRDTKTISFYANQEDLEYLFNFLMDGFKTKEKRSLTLGEDEINIKKASLSIIVNVHHSNSTNGFFYLSKRQTERLFGKR